MFILSYTGESRTGSNTPAAVSLMLITLAQALQQKPLIGSYSGTAFLLIIKVTCCCLRISNAQMLSPKGRRKNKGAADFSMDRTVLSRTKSSFP